MVYQELDINLFYTGGPPQWAYITQGDTTLGGFRFNIINGSEYWTIPGNTVFYLNGSRPDGHGFSYPCIWSGHTVECAVEESMSDYAGEVPCVLVAYDGTGKQVGSQQLIVYVKRNPMSNVKLEVNDFKTIERAIAAASTNPTISLYYDSSSETFVASRY